ncbi:MAG: radical SAM protein [Myxococcota bacterium]|nr:radical SAM protein [Myxococcota bacterium]MDW8362753.1 radical SAM protein [Myxococcales bacterium]
MAKEDSLRVNEIYASIQGESTFAGLPCTFVRLTGCNLRCVWCDTAHAFYEGERMRRSEVLERALAFGTPLVEVTGGEPLLQPGTLPLLRELADAGRTVLLETSGERDVSGVDPRVHRIVDLKAPGSGESHRNRWSNLACLGARDELKIVLVDRADYEWARDVVTREKLHERLAAVLFSPAHGVLEPHRLAGWIVADRLPVRLQLQLHKYVWSPDARGV